MLQVINQNESIMTVKSLKTNSKRVLVTLNNRAEVILYEITEEGELE